MANADLRVNLQHHESLEPSQLLEEFRTLNRSIEHLCRDISERHIERLGIIFKDLTTTLVRNPHEFCRLLPGVEKGPSLYWSAERKFRPLKDAADYAFRDIINRELVGRIFDPFHPSLREFTATDREFKRTYESMRKASTQISCGRWRALCFQYIDVQSRNRAVDTDNVALDIDTVALDMERVLLGPLLSSLQNRNPTPISLSQFQISALKTILAAAYEWNRKFDERSMQYLGNKKVVDSSRQIISVASLGLESSDAGKAGAQPNRVWPEKIRVITEDCFEQT
ncbi:uncharacterized protein EI90DRAFT_2659400 [Cantharellus anzutake]|uniref:uncharacterized protein n=1 Tax=Cantharellus anzutake TaxID=1750568 RepID=UPI0019055C3D|nr:uncharacterized protein EI90DRAFT_2659400 [Cantharellus anzutake]KAF8337510.1 hypothetical protein EI90DRAFT_2659400 [Cantharellus anzutake]